MHTTSWFNKIFIIFWNWYNETKKIPNSSIISDQCLVLGSGPPVADIGVLFYAIVELWDGSILHAYFGTLHLRIVKYKTGNSDQTENTVAYFKCLNVSDHDKHLAMQM